MDGGWCGTELPESLMFNTLMMVSGRPAVNASVVISANTQEYNLIDDAFGGVAPSGITAVDLTINSGVIVYGVTEPAMDLTGLPDGSYINMTNLGHVIGFGGAAGDGMSVESETDGLSCIGSEFGGSAGSAGGDAITCDGDVALNITNAAGFIFGGGGGGGGGSSCLRGSAPCQSGGGGGGGGGAGSMSVGGAAGAAGDSTWFSTTVCTASVGNVGTGGSSGAGGSGGAGCGGACTGSAGGAGGEYGASGTVGSGGGKAGGAGGDSVSHTGAGAVTYVSGGSQGVDIKGTTS